MSDTLIGAAGLFGDEMVSATDLARHLAEVLNKARTSPITISRNNNEQFALMLRQQARDLVEAASVLGNSVEVIAAAWATANGGRTPSNLSWLRNFDRDELFELSQELSAVIEAAHGSGNWRSVKDLITHWQRSAVVIEDGLLGEALTAPPDETPLTDPATVQDEREPRVA